MSILALYLASSSVYFFAPTGLKNYPRVRFLGCFGFDCLSLNLGGGISTASVESGAWGRF